jgi:hypothetical protein
VGRGLGPGVSDPVGTICHMREGYDVAEICLNGHVVTEMAASYPQHRKPFCPDCGSATITACPSCEANIQGYYHVTGVIGGYRKRPAPAFCHNCGEPYPWTAARLKAAKELAHEAEGLDEEERELLASSLDDLVADTPRTQLAASRFKRLLTKMGQGGAGAMRDIVVDIASETAKKAMGL